MTTTVIGYAANTDSSKLKTKGEQNELSEIQQDVRKKLKQKLKLSYTHPDFEKMLDATQKEAIINSLKKWKLDLPTNNTFTVTSIGNLKDPNNKVIYMWSSTPNPNWEQSKTPTAEDSETGDPRFIRTEFNVLLNKAPKKAWKATIEQDNDLKTELNNIPESEISTDEKNVLFGYDKADNLFTAKSEVLIDSDSTTTTEDKEKKVGLLDFLFASPKVSAGPNDYSWPWANGGVRNVSQSWHGLPPNGYDGFDSEIGQSLKNIALDVSMPNSGIAGTNVLAPISGTTARKCNDQYNSTVVIGNMRILHMSPYTNFGKYSQDITFNKGDVIGTVSSNITSINNPSNLSCGSGDAPHLHIKFLANNMVVDGTTITYGNNYNSFTSQNGTTTTLTTYSN